MHTLETWAVATKWRYLTDLDHIARVIATSTSIWQRGLIMLPHVAMQYLCKYSNGDCIVFSAHKWNTNHAFILRCVLDVGHKIAKSSINFIAVKHSTKVLPCSLDTNAQRNNSNLGHLFTGKYLPVSTIEWAIANLFDIVIIIWPKQGFTLTLCI